MVDLIARFGRAAVWMAAFQILVLLFSLGYGLWPPSLGSHVVLPGLVMVGTFAVLIWLTLTRPWGDTFDFGETAQRETKHGGRAHARMISVFTLGIGGIHYSLLESARERVREFESTTWMRSALLTDDKEAWAADTWGRLIVSDGGFITGIILPMLILGVLWLFLPR